MISEEYKVVLDLIKDFLGEPRKVYDSKHQYGFDCPNCMDLKGLDHGDKKGNLEVNLNQLVFHCWSCGISGAVGKLVDDYGSKKHKKIYNMVRPTTKEDKFVEKKNKIKLPEGFMTFKESNSRFIPHIEAYRYLNSRGITDDIIEKYNIGYTVKGDYAYRIIVPSFDIKGNLNYFVARTWVTGRLKYKNPPAAKDEIIFNEKNINWDEDIYIVEGVFDAFFLDNPVIMLGKSISNLLFETIYEKSNKNIIICLDGDAFNNALDLYNVLNGGRLYGKIKLMKFPKDKDVCDLKGNISDYYYEVK